MSKPQDLVQGTLDLLLLKILALEPMNGHADQPAAEAGVGRRAASQRWLALSRAAQARAGGLLTATWQTTENNRRAKFYALSRAGRRHLDKEAENWSRLSTAITHVVNLRRA